MTEKERSQQWIAALPKKDVSIFAHTSRLIVGTQNDSTQSIKDISDLVAMDIGLASNILEMANSALFNPLGSNIDTIDRAIVILGLKKVRSIALTASMVESTLSGQAHTHATQEMAFSFLNALIIEALYQHNQHPLQDTIYTAALLDRVGHFMYWCSNDESQDQLLKMYNIYKGQSDSAEREVLGFSLDTLSHSYLELWNMSNILLNRSTPFFRLAMSTVRLLAHTPSKWSAFENSGLEDMCNHLNIALDELNEISHQSVSNARTQLDICGAKNASNALLAFGEDSDGKDSANHNWGTLSDMIDFLAHVSHELRTPMSGIVSVADVLSETPLTEEQQEYIDIIQTTGSTVLSMTNDILDYAKNTNQKTELESTPISMIDTIIQSAKLYSHTTNDSEVWIIIKVGPDIPKRVLGDPTKVSQIINNVLSNAVKFTDKGHIVIAIEAFVDEWSDCEFTIKISDTGIGISKESQELIFDQFLQANADTTRKFGGTGLGLAIVKQLTELMQGSIQVESEPGVGAEFEIKITLPLLTMEYDVRNKGCSQRSIVIYDPACALSPLTSDVPKTLNNVTCICSPHDLTIGGSGLKNDNTILVVIGGHGIENYYSDISILSRIISPQMTLGIFSKDISYRDDLFDRVIVNRVVSFMSIIQYIDQKATDTCSENRLSADNPSTIRCSVLFAEDNPCNQAIMRAMFRKLGCAITLVDDGQQCLEAYIAKPHAYDIIFVDLEMPELNGFECASAIRSYERTCAIKPIPIYAVSGHTSEHIVHESGSHGLDGFLTKPISLDDFRGVIESSDHSESEIK